MIISSHLTSRTLVESLQHALRLYRRRGLRRTGYAIFRRFAVQSGVTRWLDFCAVDLWHLTVTSSPTPRRLPRHFIVRRATDQDAATLALYYGDSVRVETRLKRGDLCIIALCQDALCAAVWIAVGPCQFEEDQKEMGCTFFVPRDVGWTYDGKGTRLGAWGTLMKQLPSMLLDQTLSELVTMIDCNNWQSIDGHRSLGYVSVGALACTRCFGRFCHLLRVQNNKWKRLPQVIAKIRIEACVK